MKRFAIIAAAMAICIGAAAQNGGQDYNALVEQNQAAVESAAQNLKDQSQRNNRQDISALKKETRDAKRDLDQSKKDLKNSQKMLKQAEAAEAAEKKLNK